MLGILQLVVNLLSAELRLTIPSKPNFFYREMLDQLSPPICLCLRGLFVLQLEKMPVMARINFFKLLFFSVLRYVHIMTNKGCHESANDNFKCIMCILLFELMLVCMIRWLS